MRKSVKSLSRLRGVLANVQCQLSLAAYTKVDSRWRQYNFVPEFNRFYYIQEGEGALVIDGTTYYPKPGQLFVMPSGVTQSYYTTNGDNPFGKLWCHFTANLGDANLFRFLKSPYWIDVPDQERMIELFRRLIASYRSPQVTAGLLQKAVLLEIVSEFLETAFAGQYEPETVVEDEQMHKIQRILAFIERHLHENITIPQMAEHIHFHPNYFIRHFHELVGIPPMQYVHRLRMDKAKLQLSTTGKSISEIAGELGMELYYFSRSFRKAVGMSPTEYRHTFGQES
ncbi:MAG: AraC family transcriptional regulator [Paenibacillaceae bacterium]|nr:AraC family transcriptional regulator [Paenibacillaceae bacterium]